MGLQPGKLNATTQAGTHSAGVALPPPAPPPVEMSPGEATANENMGTNNQGIQQKQSQEEAKPQIRSGPLRYNRELSTGFGDRLSVYLNVAAAAATVGADVYTYWFESAPSLHHAKLSLAEIESFVTWPKNLHVLSKGQFDIETANYQDIQFNVDGVEKSFWGLDSVYTTAWKTFKLPDGLPPLTSLKYEAAFRKVASEFQLKSVNTDVLPKNKYAVLHVRGTDKPAPFEEFCTCEVLRGMAGMFPLVVITDDEDRLTAILNNVTEAQLKIVRLPPQEGKYEGMMQDFAALLSASVIVQHSAHAWSSFSSVAAMIRERPLLNTWRPPRDQGRSFFLGTLAGFDRKGAVPGELSSGNRPEAVLEFLGRARARANNPDEPRSDWQVAVKPVEPEGPVVEDQVRFLMVLGPEGSSHSFVSAMFHNSTTKKLLESMEEGLDLHVQLQRSLYNFWGKAGLWDWPCKVDHRAPEEVFEAVVRSLGKMKRKAMLALARKRRRSAGAAAQAPMQIVIPLNSADEPSAGMGSYPNFNGPCRSLQYPDVDAAMLACQAAGVNCSLLVLLRDVQEVIHSTAVRRGFQEKHSQVKLMVNMLSVIHTQLESHLGHPHWCWEYGEPDTAPLADALGLTRPEVAAMFASSFKRSVFDARKRQQLYDGLHQAEFAALRHAALRVRRLCGLPGESFAMP